MLCKFKNNVNASMRTGYMYPIENENILENKKSEEKKEIMTSLNLSSKNKGYFKRIYIREKKKSMK